MNEKIIEALDISKTFKVKKQSVRAVDSVSFSIKKGECLGLIGESGSGKSTVAQIIAGFETADSGTLNYLNRDIDMKKRDYKSRFGMQMIFQDPLSSLNPKMKIKKILSEAALYLSDMKEKDRLDRAAEVLELVRLPREYLEKYPYELSGGECQRAAIARSIMLKPQLLICDEITSALDVSVQAQILKIINDLKNREKVSILFITHDLLLVNSVCDNIAVMHQGRIVETGKTDEIIRNCKNEYTKQLMDSILTVK